MPIYQFINEKTGQTIDKIMSMNEEHSYTDKDGLKWERVWTIPQSSIDTVWNANSNIDFVNKSASKKGTYGDLLDKSAELSEIRKKQYGDEDPIKRKKWTEYEKVRGVKHLDERKQIAKQVTENVMIKLKKKIH